MRDVASCIHSITGRIAIMDRKRKLEMANRLQLRWQRWEMSNYEYLMQACYSSACPVLFKASWAPRQTQVSLLGWAAADELMLMVC